MSFLAVVVGVVLVMAVVADMINTLVSTNTSSWRWWLSRRITLFIWRAIRAIASRMPEGDGRERLLSTFAPILVLVLLVAWVTQQVVGFALIWWGLGGVSGVDGFADNLYFSGVVFFTVGFGEVVPVASVPRFGALIEAFTGVLTTALVIGYLPALYAAYSERERKLMTLDDGTNDRITPTNLVKAWAPSGDTDELLGRFSGWEEWAAGLLETHTTFPMLVLFRSQHRGQNWITALGLLADAALLCEIIDGAQRRAPYFVLRRCTRILNEMTAGADLSAYRTRFDAAYVDGDQFADLYRELGEHGFKLVPFDEARATTLELRVLFDAQLEYLIDNFLAPRGFWGQSIATAETPSSAGDPTLSAGDATERLN